MLGKIGVEPGPLTINRQPTQEPRARELLKSIVDRCQRHRDAFPECFLMKHVGSEMMVPAGKEYPGELEPLPRWPKASIAEPVADLTRQTRASTKSGAPALRLLLSGW